jgi:hypothetical protein
MADLNVVHQDRILKIDKNGNIIGLPKKFMPAQFDLNKNRLRINNKEIIFPKCISTYYEEHKNPKLLLTASWYHPKTSLPYYLNFQIKDSSVGYGYHILIDLETLELIYIHKTSSIENTTSDSRVDISKECLAEYKKAIRNVN